MATRNDITGDFIQTKLTKSTAYEDNFDRIFRNKNKADVAEATPAADQPVEPTQAELWSDEDEQRQEIIGQNGNVGYSLDDEAVSPDAAQSTEATNG